MQRCEEVLDRFFFRPEVAQKFAGVCRENCALFGDEFLDRRMTFSGVFLYHGLMLALALHGRAPDTASLPNQPWRARLNEPCGLALEEGAW